MPDNGAYQVTASLEEKTIRCHIIDTPPHPIPEDQIILKQDVERSLTVLTELFDHSRDQERFPEYFRYLVTIARDGLEGGNVQTTVARRTLADFQSQVVTREAGRAKYRYMKRLGRYCCIPSGLFLIMAFALTL